MNNMFDSPFIVPVAGCLMVLGIVIAGVYSEMRQKEFRSQERIAMISRGIPLSEVERLMATGDDDENKKVRDPLRSLGNARRAATVLVSVGFGLGIFGFLLYLILQHRPVLIVSAAGVINICIGIGFLIDYNMQKRELARFGMEVEADRP